MRAELVNPFLTAARDVFQTMFECDLVRGTPSLKRACGPELDVSGMIGLSGDYQGMVVLSLGRETAIRAAEILLGHRPGDIDEDVVDAVGEITNMIAGSAKAMLGKPNLNLGLPTVVCGAFHFVRFPTSSVPIVLPFDSPLGPICIEIGLTEAPTEVGSHYRHAARH
ncbi:MAG: chemotaxis protein CheX [Planctomycetes bacterium]|nr:chemotaxis protein CheX [Planctomycetota bacterium]